MRILVFCGSLALCLAGTQLADAQTKRAEAVIKDAEGKTIGTARLDQQAKGVRIRLNAKNLPPGDHGFHIHETGLCEAPKFTSAGGHFNPTKKHHGSESPDGAHVGDLKNLTVEASGSAKVDRMIDQASLSEGPNNLLKQGGTAIIVDAKPDDYKTDPTGNAGDRIACGVITAK